MSNVPGNKAAPIRAMVTDDTSLYRRTISDILDSLPDVEVIAAAYDGEDCLIQATKLMPDFITMDMQMPRRDGLSTLEEIKRRKLPIHVVMVCSQTAESAEQTVQALRMGALDMILKPNSGDMLENKKSLVQQLQYHVQTVRALKGRRHPFSGPATISTLNPKGLPESNLTSSATSSIGSREVASARQDLGAFVQRPVNAVLPKPRKSANPRCICIGVSTGGPQSLGTVIQNLPEGLSVPILIVQHMPPLFTKSLADHLNRSGRVRVSEAVDGEMALPGKVYIAPGGKQMRVEIKGTGLLIRVTDDPPVGACKPSVDYLFDSVERCVGGDAVAIILTGMGNDGLASCRRLHASGACIIAQNAETCVVYGMPRQIVDNNLAHEILPLEEIAGRMVQLVAKKSFQCN